jgi:hypothetical protein
MTRRPIACYAQCLDLLRPWAEHAYAGPGGVYALAPNGRGGWTVYRLLTDESTHRACSPPFASFTAADRAALEYAEG